MRYTQMLGAALLGAVMLAGAAVAGNPKPVTTVPEQLLRDLQEDFDLTKPQAAAIVGNLAHESGNFRMLKQIKGTCYGYPQWCGARRDKFSRYAGRAGGLESYDANYGFIRHELQTEYSSTVARIRKSRSLDEAARIFMREFLRPAPQSANLSKRIHFAKAYLAGDFDGAGCFSHHRLEARNKPAPCPGDA